MKLQDELFMAREIKNNVREYFADEYVEDITEDRYTYITDHYTRIVNEAIKGTLI